MNDYPRSMWWTIPVSVYTPNMTIQNLTPKVIVIGETVGGFRIQGNTLTIPGEDLSESVHRARRRALKVLEPVMAITARSGPASLLNHHYFKNRVFSEPFILRLQELYTEAKAAWDPPPTDLTSDDDHLELPE